MANLALLLHMILLVLSIVLVWSVGIVREATPPPRARRMP
jgi:hypothetical protein